MYRILKGGREWEGERERGKEGREGGREETMSS